MRLGEWWTITYEEIVWDIPKREYYCQAVKWYNCEELWCWASVTSFLWKINVVLSESCEVCDRKKECEVDIIDNFKLNNKKA